MTSEAQPFVHLRVHSAYSLLEGALTIAKLAALARADGAPALALTDSNNLFGALEFSETLAEAGIQPIVGLTLSLTFAAERDTAMSPGELNRARADGRIALLAKDPAGYANLMRLSTDAYFAATESGEVVTSIADLALRAEGLIALTGGFEGPIDGALAEGNAELARARIEALKTIFGDRLYVELQRHGLPQERAVEPLLLNLAYELDLPIVATNEPYFETVEDFEAQDALICIAQGSYVAVDERRRLSPEHYFKTAQQMRELFADLPEAIDNTVEIARRTAFRPMQRQPILPPYLTGGEASSALGETEAAELRRQSEAGLKERIVQHGVAPGHDEADYAARLAFELDVITGMNYQGYFLIVADFIKWAKAEGIPVGPGRGSGAGSLVAYALTITDLDPIRFGLLFERFLNPERVSMPDFDIDFCQDRRDEVIAYVRERYGAHRVAHIITFGKLQARAVLRDVGRVLQMPYGQVDRLCKLVPMNPANPITLPQAIAGEPRLQEARDRRADRGQAARYRPTPGGALPPCLDPCCRRGHRRSAADRSGAALPRCTRAAAGDPIQHEMGRGRRPGEVRLSRPQDADRDRDGAQADRAARRRHRSGFSSLGRSGDLRLASEGRHVRRVPARRSGHAGCAAEAQARPFRRHHRHRRALPTRPDGQHRFLREP